MPKGNIQIIKITFLHGANIILEGRYVGGGWGLVEKVTEGFFQDTSLRILGYNHG